MKKLAIVFAVGTAALMGGSVANAADNAVKAKTSTDVTQSSTDISAQRIAIGAAIATGATVTTGRTTRVTAITLRAGTAITAPAMTVPAITAAGPA